MLFRSVPGMQNVRNVADGGGCGCDKAAAPAEVDRGVDDREVVQALEEVMPEDEAGRREIVERRGYSDAGGHHDDSRKWFWLLHFFVLLPHVLDHSAIWKALSSTPTTMPQVAHQSRQGHIASFFVGRIAVGNCPERQPGRNQTLQE